MEGRENTQWKQRGRLEALPLQHTFSFKRQNLQFINGPVNFPPINVDPSGPHY